MKRLHCEVLKETMGWYLVLHGRALAGQVGVVSLPGNLVSVSWVGPEVKIVLASVDADVGRGWGIAGIAVI